MAMAKSLAAFPAILFSAGWTYTPVEIASFQPIYDYYK